MIVVSDFVNPNPGIGAYQAFDISGGVGNRKFLFGHYIEGQTTNNVAAYLAIVHAIGYALRNGMQDDIIWSDSVTAIAWVRKREDNANRALLETDSIVLLDRANKFLHDLPLNDFDTINNVKWWDKKALNQINPADFAFNNTPARKPK